MCVRSSRRNKITIRYSAEPIAGPSINWCQRYLTKRVEGAWARMAAVPSSILPAASVIFSLNPSQRSR